MAAPLVPQGTRRIHFSRCPRRWLPARRKHPGRGVHTSTLPQRRLPPPAPARAARASAKGDTLSPLSRRRLRRRDSPMHVDTRRRRPRPGPPVSALSRLPGRLPDCARAGRHSPRRAGATPNALAAAARPEPVQPQGRGRARRLRGGLQGTRRPEEPNFAAAAPPHTGTGTGSTSHQLGARPTRANLTPLWLPTPELGGEASSPRTPGFPLRRTHPVARWLTDARPTPRHPLRENPWEGGERTPSGSFGSQSRRPGP